MAENDQEKTEQKSQKKWEKARDKGELPHSKEVSTFVIFLVVLAYFFVLRTYWFDAFGAVVADLLSFEKHLGLNEKNLSEFMMRPAMRVALIMSPFFLIILFVSFLVGMSQTGFTLAKKKMDVDWNKLDPMKGLKRMVSLKSWVEGLKSAFKIALFATVVFVTLRDSLDEIVELPAHDLRHQLNYLLMLVLTVAFRMTILMAVFALFDFAFQWWQFQNTLKMSPQEVKDEMKEHEGDPLVRQRMKSLRQQMARNRMMSEVPKADVVVTNPTHFAVAIKFDQKRMPAPFVTAKGAQHLALRIRQMALEHRVPIIENPPIARALYQKVKVGQAIPSDFYRVIAELLAFVFLLKKRRGGSAAQFSTPLRPRLKASVPEGATAPGGESGRP